MSSPALLPLSILALIVTVSAQELISPPKPTQDGLTLLFKNSRDPRTAVACFTSYIVESNLISANYSAAYSACLSTAQDSRRGIDLVYLPKRRSIEKAALNLCNALSECSKINGTLKAFNCHASAGSNNTVAVYNISSSASDSAQVMLESYRLIDFNHEQCNQKAKRTYVQTTTRTYYYLQACLDGRIQPKPEITTTTTEGPTTTTTESPTTTTTESTTTTTTESTSTTTTGAPTTSYYYDSPRQAARYSRILQL